MEDYDNKETSSSILNRKAKFEKNASKTLNVSPWNALKSNMRRTIKKKKNNKNLNCVIR